MEHAALVPKTASFPNLCWGQKWGLESCSRPLVLGPGPCGPEPGRSAEPGLESGFPDCCPGHIPHGMGGWTWLAVTGLCPCQQRPSDYGIPMDVEMAYVQDNFLTNDILHEMVSSLLGAVGGAPGKGGGALGETAGLRVAECATSGQGSDPSVAETQVPDSCPPAPRPSLASLLFWNLLEVLGLAPLHLPLTVQMKTREGLQVVPG